MNVESCKRHGWPQHCACYLLTLRKLACFKQALAESFGVARQLNPNNAKFSSQKKRKSVVIEKSIEKKKTQEPLQK